MAMTDMEKRNEMGLVGEKIVTNMLNSLGLKIEHSVNKYDSEKDMLVDGYKVEVKTVTPYVKKNCFSFRPNQLRKCTSVDVLYFVSVPHPKYPHKSDGWIYRVETKSFKTTNYKTRAGIEMVGIPIDQPAVIAVKKMSDDEIAELKKYTVTQYG